MTRKSLPLTYVAAVGDTWSSADGVCSKKALYVNGKTVGE